MTLGAVADRGAKALAPAHAGCAGPSGAEEFVVARLPLAHGKAGEGDPILSDVLEGALAIAVAALHPAVGHSICVSVAQEAGVSQQIRSDPQREFGGGPVDRGVEIPRHHLGDRAGTNAPPLQPLYEFEKISPRHGVGGGAVFSMAEIMEDENQPSVLRLRRLDRLFEGLDAHPSLVRRKTANPEGLARRNALDQGAATATLRRCDSRCAPGRDIAAALRREEGGRCIAVEGVGEGSNGEPHGEERSAVVADLPDLRGFLEPS